MAFHKILQDMIVQRSYLLGHQNVEKQKTVHGHTYVFRLRYRDALLIALNLIFFRIIISNHHNSAIFHLILLCQYI